MRINVGIRRRLAPLMENSRRRIELMNSLLFSFPGTPVIYYGDEIGMGDNIYLGDRNGVRTPMQWTSDRNAGFSRADPARLYAAPIMDPVYGYQAVNVEAQERSAYSMLHWMKRLIGLRKQFKVFGRGTLEFLPTQNRKVLAYLRRYDSELVLCVSNLARTLQPVELDLSAFTGMTPVEMLGLTEFPRIGDQPYFLTLAPYHSCWFRLQQSPTPPIAARLAPEATPSPDALPAFFMGVSWETLLEGNVRTLIEREALAPFLLRQRWFAGKARQLQSARFVDWGLLRRGDYPMFLTIVEVEYKDGRERYVIPLTILSNDSATRLMTDTPSASLARVTGARKGVIADGSVDDEFAVAILHALEQEQVVRTKRGHIQPHRTPVFEALRGEGALAPHRLALEQSNTSITFGGRLIAKVFRRVEAGPNPDVEIGEHLTTSTDFRRAPRVAGAFEYRPTGEPSAHLAVFHELVPSQADGWNHALAELERFFEAVEGHGEPPDDVAGTAHVLELSATSTPTIVCEVAGVFIDTARTLGRRTAELHLALASHSADPAFVPEPFVRADVDRLLREAKRAAQRTRRARRPANGSATRAVVGRTEPLGPRHERPHQPAGDRAARAHRRAHAHSRRLPSRSGPVGRGRLLHPRFRRRTGAAARGASIERIAAQGRGRHAALVQLRGVCGAVRAHRNPQIGIRAAGTLGARLARLDECGLSCAGTWEPCRMPRCCPPPPHSNGRFSISTCWTKRSTS